MPLTEKRKRLDSRVPFYTNIPGAKSLSSGSRTARFSNVGTFNAPAQSGSNIGQAGTYTPLPLPEATRRGRLTGLTGEQYNALRGSAETKRRRAAEKARLTSIGELARQRLVGEQQREAVTIKSIRDANAASIEYGRKLTLGELKHPRDIELAKIKSEDKFKSLFSESGEMSSGEFEGNQKDYTFAQFAEAPPEKQRKYMAYMKKFDPERYLNFYKQYKLLYAPEEETPSAVQDNISRPIYQSDSGTYRNY